MSVSDFGNPIHDRYPIYRRTWKSLANDIMEDVADKKWMEDAAAFLGMIKKSRLKSNKFKPSKNVIMFDSQHDMDILMEFILFDWKPEGISAVEKYASMKKGVLGQVEEALLQAALQSKASLFEVVDTDPLESVVVLKDLLNPDAPETKITDRGFSITLEPEVCLFVRILRLPELSMTSGGQMAFPPMDVTKLVINLPIKPSEEDAYKYKGYYKLYRQFGLEVNTI